MRVGVVVGIAAVIAVVFGPAVTRPFASDHLWYLAELNGDRSLWHGLSLIDYTAVRTFWPGDTAIFRPLTYAWFAIEHWLWGADYVSWNIAGLALHALVVLAAYRLMARSRPSGSAHLLVWLVAIPAPMMDMVIWSNVSGFLWATLWLLIGLEAFRQRRLATWILVMTAAVFFAEFSLPVAAVGAWMWRRKAAWIPVGLYAVAYVVHLVLVDANTGTLAGVQAMFDPGWIGAVPRRLGALLGWWGYQMVFPGVTTLTGAPYDRIVMSVVEPWRAGPASLLIGVASIIVLARWSRLVPPPQRPVDVWPLVAAPVLVLAVYSVGRPAREVMAHSYYLYPCWVLGLVALHSRVQIAAGVAWKRAAVSAVLLGQVTVHAVAARHTSEREAAIHADAHRYLQRVSSALDDQRPDAIFSIVDPPTLVDPQVFLMLGDGDPPPGISRRVTEILFAPRIVRDGGAPLHVAGATADTGQSPMSRLGTSSPADIRETRRRHRDGLPQS